MHSHVLVMYTHVLHPHVHTRVGHVHTRVAPSCTHTCCTLMYTHVLVMYTHVLHPHVHTRVGHVHTCVAPSCTHQFSLDQLPDYSKVLSDEGSALQVQYMYMYIKLCINTIQYTARTCTHVYNRKIWRVLSKIVNLKFTGGRNIIAIAAMPS